MRLQNAQVYASLSLTGLLALALTGVGCAGKPIETTYPAGPTVVAVYALDLNNGFPDVQVWSSTEPTRTSPMPPSYGAFRIEFDQPVKGSTIANMNDLSGESFCSKFAGGAVTLHDPNDSDRELEWSLCYDSSSGLGSYPHVTGVLGNGVGLNSTPDSPFSCQDFSGDDGSNDPKSGGLILKPKQTYTLKFKSSITSQTGAAFVSPTDSSLDYAKWASGNLTLKTSGFEIMAVGYQNQNTGYYAFLKKPYAGFFKDIDEGKLYPSLADFTVTADGTSMLIFTTYGIAEGTIEAFRGDDSDPTMDVSSFAANLMGVTPIIGAAVTGGAGWEPGQTYKIKVGADLKSTEGELIDSAKEYTFKVEDGDPAIVVTSPSNGAVAQGMFSGGSAVSYTFVTNTPVEPSTVSNTTVTLKSAAGVDVPMTVTIPANLNNQRINAKPDAVLAAGTTYTLSVSGVKTLTALPNGRGGKDVLPAHVTFVTANFRVNTLTGERTVTASPTVLRSSSGLAFTYTRPVASLTGDQFVVTEINADGTRGTQLPAADYTLTKGGTPAGLSWVFKDTNTAYPGKCKQKYEFKSLPTIASTDTPALQLSAEGCTDAAGCADVRSFTTAAFAPGALSFTRGDGPGKDKLSVTFNLPIDSVSANAAMAAGAFKLFPVNTDGTLGASLALTCPPLADEASTKLSCTADAALEANKHYLGSFIVTNATIIKSAAASGSIALDQASCTYYGSSNRSILTGCP